jgi:hypothetical protein
MKREPLPFQNSIQEHKIHPQGHLLFGIDNASEINQKGFFLETKGMFELDLNFLQTTFVTLAR